MALEFGRFLVIAGHIMFDGTIVFQDGYAGPAKLVVDREIVGRG